MLVLFCGLTWIQSKGAKPEQLSAQGKYILKRTLWKTCSLRMSVSLPLSSLTLLTMLSIFDLSSDSILDVAPMAMSRVNFTPPIVEPAEPENQPPTLMAAGPEGVKHSLCRPGSAAVNVNFEKVSEEVVV